MNVNIIQELKQMLEHVDLATAFNITNAADDIDFYAPETIDRTWDYGEKKYIYIEVQRNGMCKALVRFYSDEYNKYEFKFDGKDSIPLLLIKDLERLEAWAKL